MHIFCGEFVRGLPARAAEKKFRNDLASFVMGTGAGSAALERDGLLPSDPGFLPSNPERIGFGLYCVVAVQERISRCTSIRSDQYADAHGPAGSFWWLQRPAPPIF